MTRLWTTALFCFFALCLSSHARASSSSTKATWVEVYPVQAKAMRIPIAMRAKAKAKAAMKRKGKPSASAKTTKPQVSVRAADPIKALRRAANSKRSRKLSRAQTKRFRYLQHQIMAPCCWQPVAIHPSKYSKAIKADLKLRILAGESNKMIFAAYVKRFGERILSIPANPWIYLLPVFGGIVIFGVALIFVLIWRGNHNHTTEADLPADTTAQG